ncbi:MAG: hypothetical protein LBE03_00165 [Candidatus Nomurabacteria bacterium]|jgi:hypothetical protein|nr:hypothetical protein [Candidatus Nomurabacteria bacterium]
MDTNKLKELKSKISEIMQPIALEPSGDPVVDFDLLMNIIRVGNANNDIYQKAFDAASSIKDRSAKMNALLDLMTEIDITLNAESPTEAPS